MSSATQTIQPDQAPPTRHQPIGITILDWALIVLAVTSSAFALLGSRAKTMAKPQFEIAEAVSSGGNSLQIQIDAANQVTLGGQSIKDVPSLVDRIGDRSDTRQATILADEETLFATTDWVATTLINSGVDQVRIVTSRRVETTE